MKNSFNYSLKHMEEEKYEIEVKNNKCCRIIVTVVKEIYEAFLRLTNKDKEKFKKDMME